ncbi:hypothetical protein QQZ08_009549 [Neonectria magnoliae]|uniref:Heterokaryon incompatibility domain-containing protein n=1 Tax=Neonectria magnoliae TaxID=2732573 RepID=A0ABR1HNC4_9HYPO
MSQQSTPRDAVFDKVFPYHHDQAHTLVDWGEGSLSNVYVGIHVWLASILATERCNRTLTLDLTAELEALHDEVRDGYNSIPSDPEVCQTQRENVGAVANHLWALVQREKSYLRFERNLQKIDVTSLMARYHPGLDQDADFYHNSKVSLSPYLGHIYSEVRKETAAYENWKHQVNHGDPSKVSQTQPSRIWNQALAGVVHHSRDILACPNFPDPLPFESIMRILEQGDSWYRNLTCPGTFVTAERFETLDEDHVASILAQDLWSMEIRYKCLWRDGGAEIEYLRNCIKSGMEFFYHRAIVSVSGKMRTIWVKDGTATGKRIDNNDSVVGFMRFGVPAAEIVDGKVKEKSQKYTIFERNQAEVEVCLVRDVFVVLWDVAEEIPPHYEDVPPTYASINNTAISM